MIECEILIVGAGITGLTIANELLERGGENILIIEKEKRIGLHASGRNSGVLHAGIYYTPDSLKARFCAEGNRLLTEYCEQNSLNLIKSGKVIVASDEEKLDGLYILQERALKNGVKCRLIDEKELNEIEPYAYTFNKAIYSPNTSVFDPLEILKSFFTKLLESKKVKFLFDTSFFNKTGSSKVFSSNGGIKFRKLINAAGSYADKIAHSFGISRDYKMLPFLGTYKNLEKNCSHYVNGNIYPVPDLRNPFLGIHFTKGSDGAVYIGPTAIPAIGRENYSLFEGVSLESFSILYRDLVFFINNRGFRDNALSEIKKYFGSFVFNEAKKLVPEIQKRNIERSTKVGIRPQLVHWPTKELLTDFLIVEDGETIHILNTISPAFTSSMSFAKYVVSDFVLKR